MSLSCGSFNEIFQKKFCYDIVKIFFITQKLWSIENEWIFVSTIIAVVIAFNITEDKTQANLYFGTVVEVGEH